MSKHTDEGFMALAYDQAEIALNNGWIPVGAVFVRNNQVVGHGRKLGGEHKHPRLDHAELNGCNQLLWGSEGPRDLDGFEVFSTLEPCLNCMATLMTVRVSRIVWALPDPYGGGSCLLKHPEMLPDRFKSERPIFEEGLLAERSRLLLRKYFLSRAEKKDKNWSDPENPLVKLALSD